MAPFLHSMSPYSLLIEPLLPHIPTKNHLADWARACETTLLLLLGLGCAAMILSLQSTYALLGPRPKEDSFFFFSFSDLLFLPPVVQSLGFLLVGLRQDLQGYPRLISTRPVHE